MDNQVQPISLESNIPLLRWLNKVIEAGKAQLHTWKLQNVARSVKSLSGNKSDMERLAATFSGELVHKTVLQTLSEAADELSNELTTSQELFKKKSAKLCERNQQVKKLKKDVATLREDSQHKDVLIQHLLEKLGMTQDELVQELLEDQLAAMRERSEIEESLRPLSQQLEGLERALKSTKKK